LFDDGRLLLSGRGALTLIDNARVLAGRACRSWTVVALRAKRSRLGEQWRHVTASTSGVPPQTLGIACGGGPALVKRDVDFLLGLECPNETSGLAMHDELGVHHSFRIIVRPFVAEEDGGWFRLRNVS
jgi:hypothetical protein